MRLIWVTPPLLLSSAFGIASAGEADVLGVKAVFVGGGQWRFDVTVRHADAGWDHYADRWDVVAPGGQVLGTRVLLHPNEIERPFTRSLSGVRIPAAIPAGTLRARDKIHGYGGKEEEVRLAR